MRRNRNEELCKSEGTSLSERDASRIATQAAEIVVNPVRRLSYFERELAHNLGKSLTSDGQHVDLAADAASTFAPGTRQRQNRNFEVGQGGVEEIFKKSESGLVSLAPGHPDMVIGAGSYARHTRYCKTPGNVNCPVCGGIGAAAFKKALESRIAETKRAIAAKTRNR